MQLTAERVSGIHGVTATTETVVFTMQVAMVMTTTVNVTPAMTIVVMKEGNDKKQEDKSSKCHDDNGDANAR